MSFNEVAVVGAGSSGLSIAELVAEADIPVTVICVTGARRAHAARRLDKTLRMRVDVGELTPQEADAIRERVTFTREVAKVADCDLVIESAVGDAMMRRALLATIQPKMNVLENHGYHQLLLMYKGVLSPADVLGGVDAGIASATVSYGVANWFRGNGDSDGARRLLLDIVQKGPWAAFGVIAAEVELARAN